MAGAATSVLTDVGDDGVATVTLNRPEAMNAITTELAAGLERALRAVAADAGAILLRGAGGNFSAGGDFDHLQSVRDDAAALRELFERFSAACAAVGEVGVPVVAAVEGVAMAGGFELMQACDIAVVAEDARIADNHSNFAMVPGGGSTQRLPRLVGRQRASGLILSGERLSGTDAVEWGLAYRAFRPGELQAGARELAAKLAAKDRAALEKTKRLIRDGLELPLAAGLEAEIDVVVEHISGSGGEAGIESFQERV